MSSGSEIAVGTAGWSIPHALADVFPAAGTHLERYATRLSAVEINSSFHRTHRQSTYARWAASTAPHFRFAVKLPKEITHISKLSNCGGALTTFGDQVSGLGPKLRVILVQLPPSLVFDRDTAARFFDALRRSLGDDIGIACEPRHAGWFDQDVDRCLSRWRVARVAADPGLAAGGAKPGGWHGLRYYRLHGSPRTYYSGYDAGRLASLAETIRRDAAAALETWCMFDNTANGAATSDALHLRSALLHVPTWGAAAP